VHDTRFTSWLERLEEASEKLTLRRSPDDLASEPAEPSGASDAGVRALQGSPACRSWLMPAHRRASADVMNSALPVATCKRGCSRGEALCA
jgi:hypothetical protein